MKKRATIAVIFITIFAIVIGCQRRESTKEEVYKDFQKKIEVLIIMYLFIVIVNQIITN